MSKWKQITSYVTIAILVIVAVYDVIAISKGGVEASISHMLIIKSYKMPLIPFLVGVLCGHLFWRMSDTPETREVTKDVYKKEGDT